MDVWKLKHESSDIIKCNAKNIYIEVIKSGQVNQLQITAILGVVENHAKERTKQKIGDICNEHD